MAKTGRGRKRKAPESAGAATKKGNSANKSRSPSQTRSQARAMQALLGPSSLTVRPHAQHSGPDDPEVRSQPSQTVVTAPSRGRASRSENSASTTTRRSQPMSSPAPAPAAASSAASPSSPQPIPVLVSQGSFPQRSTGAPLPDTSQPSPPKTCQTCQCQANLSGVALPPAIPVSSATVAEPSHPPPRPSGPSHAPHPLQQVVPGAPATVTSQPTGPPLPPPYPDGVSGSGSSPRTAAFDLSHRPLGEYGIPSQGLPIARPDTTSQGVDEGPLVSICDPLGATILASTREKIIKSEFIELDQLLERHFHSSPNSLTLSLDSSGQLLLKDAKKKPQITSILGWTDAFLVLSSIFIGAHPGRAQELLKYMHVIRMAAARFAGRGWMEYDRQFRLRQQFHPNRSWAIINGELWALFVTAPTGASVGFGTQKGTSSGLFKQRPLNSFRGRAVARGSGLCFAFNRTGCTNAQCKYAHKCSSCQSPEHGGASCTARSSKPSASHR